MWAGSPRRTGHQAINYTSTSNFPMPPDRPLGQARELSVELPWTQWLTWIFQTVPLLFLVAGYAGAASWTRHSGSSFGDWMVKRLRAVLGPTTAYVLVVLVLVAVAVLAHVDASAVAMSGWAVAMHLWFI